MQVFVLPCIILDIWTDKISKNTFLLSLFISNILSVGIASHKCKDRNINSMPFIGIAFIYSLQYC